MKKHFKLTIATTIVALTLTVLCVAYTGIPETAARVDNDPSRTNLTFDLSLAGPGLCDPAFGELATWQGTVRSNFQGEQGEVRARLRGLPLMLGGESVPVRFDWVVNAGTNSFTAPLEGSWNIKTGKLEMNGTVTEGFRAGERARLMGKLVDLRNLRFKGEMHVGGLDQ